MASGLGSGGGDDANGGGAIVSLAIYDLSHGMAQTLSAQFLGPNHVIDMIPHTGIVVFEKEYYFGGGIQSMKPTSFRNSTGMQPVQILPLGTTHKTRSEFHAWCRSPTIQSKYTATTYDLLQNNCNHFSYDCAAFLLSSSSSPSQTAATFPQWILQVPQQFLSSPMGQMVRPMLEQMQVQMRNTTSPSSNRASSSSTTTPRQPAQSQRQQPQIRPVSLPASTTTTTTTTAPKSSSSSSSSTAASRYANNNPWANLPSQSKETKTSSSKPNPQPLSAPSKQPPPTVSSSSSSSTLDKYSKPLLSKDVQTIKLCIQKLSPHFSNSDVKTILQEKLANFVLQKINHTSTTKETAAVVVVLSAQEYNSIVLELWQLLQNDTATSFVLLLLRLLVLIPVSMHNNNDKNDNDTTATTLESCLEWMIHKKIDTTTTDDSTIIGWKTPVERSLAWCVLSNHVATTCTNTNSRNNQQNAVYYTQVVDAAIVDLSHKQVSVRQAASTFLYNFVLQRTTTTNCSNGSSNSTDELLSTTNESNKNNNDDDTMVSILCACLESITEETDATTKLRRLLASGRIVYPMSKNNSDNNGNDTAGASSSSSCNTTAKALLHDLGFVELLQNMAVSSSSSSSVTKEQQDCQLVAAELVHRLTN